jgi:hypothetical protein
MDIGKHGSSSKITFYCRLVEQRDSDVLFKIKHQLTHLCKIYEHTFEIVPFFHFNDLGFLASELKSIIRLLGKGDWPTAGEVDNT